MSNSKNATLQVNTEKREYEIYFEGGIPSMIEARDKDATNVDGDVEQIGLTFEGKVLIDYDGVFDFPKVLIGWFELLGFDMSYVTDNVACKNCGKLFTPADPLQICCGDECFAAFSRKRLRDAVRDVKRSKYLEVRWVGENGRFNGYPSPKHRVDDMEEALALIAAEKAPKKSRSAEDNEYWAKQKYQVALVEISERIVYDETLQ